MSQVFESIRLALSSIWANKLRSLLTLLGNIVAVSSIITVVALIQGMNTTVTQAVVSDLGADTFTIDRMGMTTSEEELERARGNPRITIDEAEAIERFSPFIQSVMAQANASAPIAYGLEEIESVRVQGVSGDYADFSTFDAERGRMLSPTEVERSRPVVVLGWEVADRLFGQTEALEKIVRISGRHFRVVGVSEKKGAIFGNSMDSFAVMPLGAFRKLFGARQSLQVMVKPRHASLVQEAKDDARVALRVKRRLEPTERDNFGIVSSDSVLDIYNQATAGIFAVLVGIVALSLVVGGIVIMNIMLMVVSERTREIGLRKALGAKRRDIMSQVLTESITLSLTGGIVGVAIG
ncbi:MAG: ABC transporter permease, partial [Acidobacteria bacterium]|nr:ABC transporter permease [Acidobacteriota bacterium]